MRQIEDGPYGGTDLQVGDEMVGEMLTALVPEEGGNWGGVRLLDYSLAQTAHALSESKLWLPGQPAALDLKVAPLGVVGKLGLVDRDINGPAPRGPFSKVAPSPTATYPALWNHNAGKRNSHGLRTGLAATSASGNGVEGCRSLGYCQPMCT